MTDWDYNATVTEVFGSVDGHMCFPVDWLREDLPLEDKDSAALDQAYEGFYNEAAAVPKYLETFVKPPSLMKAFWPVQPPPRESVLVFADRHGYCSRIMKAAPEGRVSTKKVIESDQWQTMDDSEVMKIISSTKWDLVLFGAGLDSPASNHVANIIDQQNVVCRLFLELLRAIGKTENAKRLAVVTKGVFSDDPATHAKFGLSITTNALLFGMSNSARQEFEETDIQYIDTEISLTATGDEDKYKIFPRIASDIFRVQTFGHNSVRILNNGRYVLRQMDSREYEEANYDFIINEGTIAIGGGNGALGLVMGEWLLDKAREQGIRPNSLTIKFLSRSMKISDLNMPTWKAIQAKAAELGITVEQEKADVSSQEAVDALISSLSPNLVGFIHSAGVLQDSMLMNLTWEKCETVFESKHRAALYLHSALERFENPKLGFFWVFSSTAVWGNMGQINYSGSNSFLDALARHRRARGKPCTAIQWGAWGEVGMAATMTDSMRARTMSGPQPYFTNVEGRHGLELGLKTGLPYFSVFKFNPGVMFAMIGGADSPKQCMFRNFSCEIFPTDLGYSLERNHMYTAYRTSLGWPYRFQPGVDRLVYDTYTKPAKEEYEKEWGEDFRLWSADPSVRG